MRRGKAGKAKLRCFRISGGGPASAVDVSLVSKVRWGESM